MASQRKLWLGVSLVATLVASFIDFSEPQGPPFATRPVGGVVSKVAAPDPVEAASAASGERGRYSAGTVDLFAAKSWTPPPVPVSTMSTAVPVAPPLPFKFEGKLLEDGKVVAFISQGAFTHVLHKGDVLSGYRVDDITPLEMTLVYLPLNEKQRLIFGSAN
jgi:hypothetical protein